MFSPHVRDRDLTLDEMINQGALRSIREIQAIASRASCEHAVEKTIERIGSELLETYVHLDIHRISRSYVMRNGDSLLDLLEDVILRIQSVALDPHVEPHVEAAEYWNKKVRKTHEIVVVWIELQRKYVRLSPLFKSENEGGMSIGEIPLESAKFAMAVDEWNRTMQDILSTCKEGVNLEHCDEIKARIFEATGRERLLDRFHYIGSILDSILKSVRVLLGRKRSAYPRLCFISDDELIDALKLDTANCIACYVPRLIPGCGECKILNDASDFQFADESEASGAVVPDMCRITSLSDPYGEQIVLNETCMTYELSDAQKTRRKRRHSCLVNRRGDKGSGDINPLFKIRQLSIDEWMKCLESGMAVAVRHSICVCFRDCPFNMTTLPAVNSSSDRSYQGDDVALTQAPEIVLSDRSSSPSSLENWLSRHPSQAINVTLELIWTEEMELALCAKSRPSSYRTGLHHMEKKTNGRIQQYVSHIKQVPEGLVDHMKLGAVIVRSLYHRDVAARLAKQSPILATEDFEWIRCLRYYSIEIETSERKDIKSRMISIALGITNESSKRITSLQKQASDNRIADFGLLIRCATAEIRYNNEFIGCTGHLVVTPITERAFLSLAMALKLSYAPAPQGPSGTGKTESCKDLARLCGRYVVVMNCSDGIDISSMSRIMEGISASGAWACFDELNRLPLGVLSYVSSLLLRLQTALRMRSATCEFDATGEKITVPVNDNCACFVTMNPGYMSRNPLPESLSFLLRPVAMMAADLRYIAEVRMLIIGLRSAQSISLKLSRFLQIAKTQIRADVHHEWGMRELQSILDAIDAQNKASRIPRSKVKHIESSDRERDEVISCKAIFQTMMPRLHGRDSNTLRKLVLELFQVSLQELVSSDADMVSKALRSISKEWCNTKIKSSEGSTVNEDAFGGVCTSSNQVGAPQISVPVKRSLGRSASMARCAARLSDSLAVRAGVIILGKAGSGKSSCLRMLIEAVDFLTAASSSSSMVDLRYLCPSALPHNCLYGANDITTNEWVDGVFTMHLRNFQSFRESDFSVTKESPVLGEECGYDSNELRSKKMNVLGPLWSDSIDRVHRWIVMDGPLLSIQIENMNSLLDDNRMLFLSSGESIALLPNARVIFECDDISSASPASVSRCGVVYISESENLNREERGCMDVLMSWLEGLPSHFKAYHRNLELLVREIFIPTIESCHPDRGKFPLLIDVDDITIAMNFTRLCTAYFSLLDKGQNILPSCSDETTALVNECDGIVRIGLNHNDVSTVLDFKNKANWHSTLSSHGVNVRLESLCIQCMIMTIACAIQNEWRDSFSRYFKQICKPIESRSASSLEKKTSHFRMSIPFPSEGSVFDYCFNLASCEWCLWSDLAALQQFDYYIRPRQTVLNPSIRSEATLSEGAFMTTLYSIQQLHVLELLVKSGHHTVICGPATCGKSVLMQQCVDREWFFKSENKRASSNMDILGGLDVCHLAATSLSPVEEGMRTIDNYLTRKKHFKYTPRVGKRGVAILLDDVHIEGMNHRMHKTAETNSSIFELLRQFVDTGGYYHSINRGFESQYREALKPPREATIDAPLRFGYVEQAQLVATLHSTLRWNGLRDAYLPVAPPVRLRRFLKHVAFVVLPEIDHARAHSIYRSYMDVSFNECDSHIITCLHKCCTACIEIATFLAKSHAVRKGRLSYKWKAVSRILDTIVTHTQANLESGRISYMLSHEIRREFVDGLVDRDGISQLNGKVRSVLEDLFSDEVSLNSCIVGIHDGNPKVEESFSFIRAPVALSEEYEFSDVADMALTSTMFELTPITDITLAVKLATHSMDSVPGISMKTSKTLAKTSSTLLVTFPSFVSHVDHLVRIFNKPHGHALLLGPRGCGKRTIARLAAKLSNFYHIHEIRASLHFDQLEFFKVLRKALQSAGALAHRTLLLIHDDSILADSVAQSIEHMLRTKCIAPQGVWGQSNEELKPIIESMKARLKEDFELNRSGSDISGALGDATLASFIESCRKNLRICWCLDPEETKERFVGNPFLFSCTTAMHIQSWSFDDRVGYAEFLLRGLWENVNEKVSAMRSDLGCLNEVQWLDQDVRNGFALDRLARTCAAIHIRLQKLNSSSKMRCAEKIYEIDFIEYIREVEHLLDRRLRELSKTLERYCHGISQMDAIENMVNDMKVYQSDLEAQVNIATSSIEELLEDVKGKRSEAASETKKMKDYEQVVAKAVLELTKLRDKCNEDLEVVMPPLRLAIADLGGINKKDISELKSMNNPPKALKLVMRAVCIMLGRHPKGCDSKAEQKLSEDEIERLYWREAQRLLGEPTCMTQMIEFDTKSLEEALINKIDDFTSLPIFNPDHIKKVSKAGTRMCKWVLAMDQYYDAMKVIAPKQRALENAEHALQQKEASLKDAKLSLEMLNASVERLEQEMRNAIQRRNDLATKKHDASEKIHRAIEIVEGLRRQRSRWIECTCATEREFGNMVCDCLVASAYTVYLGRFASSDRDSIAQLVMDVIQEYGIPNSQASQFHETIGITPNELIRWELAGLPRSYGICMSAQIVVRSRRAPFILDPEGIAHSWLRSYLKDSRHNTFVSATKLASHSLRDGQESVSGHLGDALERVHRTHAPIYASIVNGSTCIVENVGTKLSHIIEQILEFSIQKIDGPMPFPKALDALGAVEFHDIDLSKHEFCIMIGNVAVPYDPKFTIYFVSSLSKVQLPNDLNKSLNYVNFSVTEKELEAQLMEYAMKMQHPKILADFGNNRAKLLQAHEAMENAELNLLRHLASIEVESFLEKDDVIGLLTESARCSDEHTFVAMQVTTSQQIFDEMSNIYTKQLAHYAAASFGLLRMIDGICPSYKFSLDWFLKSIYREAVSTHQIPQFSAAPGLSHSASTLASYSQDVCDTFLKIYWNRLFASTFEKHHIPLAFFLSCLLNQSESKTGSDLELFLSLSQVVRSFMSKHAEAYGNSERKMENNIAISGNDRVGVNSSSSGRPAWISKISWSLLQHLCSRYEEFAGLDRAMCGEIPGQSSVEWERFVACQRSSRASSKKLDRRSSLKGVSLPSPWNELSSVKKLVVILILVPERLNEAIQEFIHSVLGHIPIGNTMEHDRSGTLTSHGKKSDIIDSKLEESFNLSSSNRPQVFIISPGEDPAARISAFAQRKRR